MDALDSTQVSSLHSSRSVAQSRAITSQFPDLMMPAFFVIYLGSSEDPITDTEALMEPPLSNKFSQSYQETMHRMCGRRWGILTSGFIAVYMFLASITYLVVVGDQTDRIFLDKYGSDFCKTWYLNRRFIIASGSVVFVWPLLYAKKIDFLKYASGAATIGIAYVVGIVIYVYATNTEPVVIKTRPDAWTDVFNVIPAICFAYQCHVSSIPIYACVRPHTLGEFTKTVTTAMLVCFVSYSSIGILGYLTYGVNTQPDILSSYNTDDWPIAVGFVLFAIKNLLTVPILLFCGRLAFEDVWVRVFGKGDDRAELWRRVISVTMIFVACVLLAVFVPNITSVVDYLGCLAACFIFIFPGLCLLFASTRLDMGWSVRAERVGLAGAAFFLVFGALLFGLIIAQAVQATGAKARDPACDPDSLLLGYSLLH